MTTQLNGRHVPSKSPLSKASTGGASFYPLEREQVSKSPIPPDDMITPRERLVVAVDRLLAELKDFFVFPEFLVQEPPGWEELTAYAHHNARLEKAPALVKTLSMIWFCAITAPTTIWARFREWVLVRPMRALLFVGVGELFIWTTPLGTWLGHTYKVGAIFILNLLLP